MKFLSSKIITLILVFIFLGCKKEKDIVSNSSPNYYSFFVAGHTYGKPGIDNIGFHPSFKEKFDLINNEELIEFGVLTGDIVLSGTDLNWNEIDSDLALIDFPVYIAAGNHDISNRDLFESRYGPTYRSFVQNSDLMIILDPNLDNWNISGDQLQFLKNVLDSNYQHVDNIFVFFLQLLWWDPDNLYGNISLNSHSERADTINFWSEIEPLFNSLPNQTYMFAGDVGAFNNGSEFMYHNYDNITFIASGMGGESRDNIVFVDVKEDKSLSFRLI
tara:strand:- start:1805 stop:2626 length:822 start_codon:yes stop_codon:yes gene_type:complete